MPVTQLPIANGFYQTDSLPLSAQQCINFYPEVLERPALNQEVLFGTPGLDLLATSGELDQVNRGAIAIGGIPYFVNGSDLYRLERTVINQVETFTLVALGTIEGRDRVSIAENGSQICILAHGGKGYIFTPATDVLVEITDPDFRANGDPQYVVFIDGYFVFTTDSKKFIISALNDGLSYNALDFGTAESSPDDIVVPMVLRNQLFIGGGSTMEAFQNVGGADFPFQRTGLFIQKGVFSPFSAIEFNDAVFFVGGGRDESPGIYALTGNKSEKISSIAIDSLLNDYSDSEIGSVFSYAYSQNGSSFVCFALPLTTLVFSVNNGRWHERKSQITNSLGVTGTVRSRVNSLVTAYGRVIAGDLADGRVGELSTDYYQEYGVNIIRIVATQPFQNNMNAFSVPRLELTMEAGVGNDDVVDPKVRLDISKDGKTFGYSRTRSMGKIGEYDRRTIWRRINRIPRFSIFRFTLSDPVKPVIMQLTADIVG